MIRLLSFIGAVLCLVAAAPAFAVTELIQSGATTPIPFLLVDSATGQTGQTGQVSNCTVTVCKPGTTSYVASSGTMTEIGNGLYDYNPTAAETGSGTTCGFTLIHVTDTSDGTQVVDASAQIVAFNPNDAAALGLSSITSTNTNVAALPSASSNAAAVWASGARTLTAQSDTPGTTTLLSRVPTFPTNFSSFNLDSSGRALLQPSQTFSTSGAVGSVTSGVLVSTNGDKTGYSLATAPPTTSEIASAILATPANLLATNSSGYVTATNGGSGSVTDSAVQTDVATALTAQGYTSALASGLATSNTDVPLIYSQTSAANQQSNVTAGVEAVPASHSNHLGKYTFNPSTNVLTLLADDGTTVLGTVTLTINGSGVVTSRE